MQGLQYLTQYQLRQLKTHKSESRRPPRLALLVRVFLFCVEIFYLFISLKLCLIQLQDQIEKFNAGLAPLPLPERALSRRCVF